MTEFRIPKPEDEPPPSDLLQLLTIAEADWKTSRGDLPPAPEVCSTFGPNKALESNRAKERAVAKKHGRSAPRQSAPVNADLWFARDFRGSVVSLANRLGLLSDPVASTAISGAIRVQLPAGQINELVLPIAATSPGGGASAGGSASVQQPRKLDRTERCAFLRSYLAPLLDDRAYGAWLGELAASQFSWKGGAAGSPKIPLAVRRAEEQHDRGVVTDWSVPTMGTGSAPPPAPSTLVASQLRSFLASQPAAPGQPTANQPGQVPVIVLGGRAIPANLFISESAVAINAYLDVLDAVVLHATTDSALQATLRAVGYGVIALGLVPVACLYDGFHGTCTIETLIPALYWSGQQLRRFARGGLPAVLAPLRASVAAAFDDSAAEQEATVAFETVTNAFGMWILDVCDVLEEHSRLFLRLVAAQSGGRVRTPARVTAEGEWRIPIDASMGSPQRKELRAAELIGYVPTGGGKTQRDTAAEVFWMLQSTWPRIGTAIALVNQAGMRCWFNAANNRWGGHHPPHIVHRQGCSFDMDVGFGWEPGHKVPNVRKRGADGGFLDDQYPGNRDLPNCLLGMNRVAGWVLVQAFIIVGISQYLYGDAALVGEASRHLAGYFNLPHPAHMDGILDAEGHSDHWHFEVLTRTPPNRLEPFVWEANTRDLFSLLYALAQNRDADDTFWRKMTGLEKAPTQESDFDTYPEGWEHTQWDTEKELWKKWWRRRSEASGVPLLPVWTTKDVDPNVGEKTLGSLTCWQKGGSFPEVFGTGALAG